MLLEYGRFLLLYGHDMESNVGIFIGGNMIAEKLELTEELEEILGHRTHPFPHSAW